MKPSYLGIKQRATVVCVTQTDIVAVLRVVCPANQSVIKRADELLRRQSESVKGVVCVLTGWPQLHHVIPSQASGFEWARSQHFIDDYDLRHLDEQRRTA